MCSARAKQTHLHDPSPAATLTCRSAIQGCAPARGCDAEPMSPGSTPSTARGTTRWSFQSRRGGCDRPRRRARELSRDSSLCGCGAGSGRQRDLSFYAAMGDAGVPHGATVSVRSAARVSSTRTSSEMRQALLDQRRSISRPAPPLRENFTSEEEFSNAELEHRVSVFLGPG